MQELEFIRYLARRFKVRKPVVKGIGDDAAVLEYTRDKYLLITADMLIEGTHFKSNAPPVQIGRKSIAVGVSDIAAMGGVPKYALVSAGISRRKGTKFLKRITEGIAKACKRFNISVIGGDTNASQRTVVDTVIIGEVEKRYLVKRSGAKPDDLIFVTGALGEGRKKHLSFLPRLKEARILARNFRINSMIDLSDGLSTDLTRIAGASGTGARIYKSLIPLSKDSLPLEKAVHAGEDFELLFTASIKESKKIIRRMGQRGDLPVTLIGEIVKRSEGVRIVGEDGKTKLFKPKGYRHL